MAEHVEVEGLIIRGIGDVDEEYPDGDGDAAFLDFFLEVPGVGDGVGGGQDVDKGEGLFTEKGQDRAVGIAALNGLGVERVAITGKG